MRRLRCSSRRINNETPQFLYFFKNLSQADISKQLAIPIGTVKSRLHHAKEKFKKHYPYKKIVKGEVVDHKTTTLSDGETAYAPVYMYSYNDKDYTTCSGKYARTKVESIGTRVDLRINEKKPEDVYFPASKASKMLIYIFGASFFITGVGMLLTVLVEI